MDREAFDAALEMEGYPVELRDMIWELWEFKCSRLTVKHDSRNLLAYFIRAARDFAPSLIPLFQMAAKNGVSNEEIKRRFMKLVAEKEEKKS